MFATFFAEFWHWRLIILCLYKEILLEAGNIEYKPQAGAYIGKNMLTLFDLTLGEQHKGHCNWNIS